MSNKQRLFLDVHVLQSVPPSNVNRDDTGSPKTALYGGALRARVSSQAWKKAMRDYFYINSEQSNVGVRTLEIVKYVAEKIMSIDPNIDKEESMIKAADVLKKANIKIKANKAQALFFMGDIQANQLAQAAVDGLTEKNKLQEILKNNPAIDIALFGRMVADDPSLNEDASAQVAHAISTHSVQTEFDYFTAVDDFSSEDHAGAGMIGTIEFNSSTLYRYANVALHELTRQLGHSQAVLATTKLFVEAFANSMPTGKVNTFANQTLPQLLLVTVRNDRPVNLVSAFEEPIKSSSGYFKESADRLFAEYLRVNKFVEDPLLVFYLTADDIGQAEFLGMSEPNLGVLLGKLTTELSKLIPKDESE